MDLRALKYFVAAVDSGSISGAAQACYVAQPSITLAINKLEDQFNCQLLTRHRKGVTCTTKGQELYHMALELLQHANSIEARLIESKKPYKVNLALSSSVQVKYVEKIIKLAHQVKPGLTFEIVDDPQHADIYLCTKSGAYPNAPFFPIERERYALLIPKNNDLAFKTTLSLNDLNGEAIIERYHCENRALFDKVIELFKLELPVVARVENEEWAISLVASGLGICISPVSEELKDDRFVVRYLNELSDMATPERQVGICCNTALSSEKSELLSQLSQVFTGSTNLSKA